MKQNKQPTPKNVVPGDTEGTTWALPENAIARLGKGKHCNIALSPNSTYFAVGTTVGLWWYEMSSKSPIALWETERGMISALDFSQNGEWIAIANYDGIIKVLNAQSGECRTQMKGAQERYVYWHIIFSPDCEWIATSNQKGIEEIWDVQEGVCAAQMDRGESEGKTHNSHRFEFSPNGQYVAATASNVGRKGSQTFIWCPETGELIFNFSGGNFTFSEDSRLLAGLTPDESNSDTDHINHCVSVWDITTGERIAYFSVKSTFLSATTFSPCGEFLVFSSRDEILFVWDMAKGAEKKVWTDFQTTRAVPFYSTEGDLFVIVDGEDTIEVWNVERREKLPTPEIHPNSIDALWFRDFPQLALEDITCKKISKLGHNIHRISTLQKFDCVPDPVLFLPDGKTLASTSARRGIALWDVESKQTRDTFRILVNTRIPAFTVLPCGNIIGAYIWDNHVYVCDAEKPNEPIAEFTEQAQLTWKMAFTSTGDRLAVGSSEGTIYLYDLKNKEKLKPFVGHTDFIPSVCFSPDGKRLASGSSDNTNRLWDAVSGEEIGTFPIDEPQTLRKIAFSPCGNLIAGGMYGELRLWCAETLTTLLAIPHSETQKPYALAFSPCGQYLASGTWWQKGMEKMAIRLWDVASGENIATLWGHTTDIQSVAFSPDGTLLASGSFDGTIILWDTKPYL